MIERMATWEAMTLRAPRLVLVALASAVLAGAAPRALLIGLDYRGGSDVTPLPGIRLDIEMMRQVALDFGIADIRELWNEDATLEGIRSAIDELRDGVSESDLVLVYYTGHGTRIPDTTGDEEDGWDEVLVPYDATPAAKTLRNVLRDDELGALLAAIPSDSVLGIIDACNSGTVAKSIGIVPKAYQYDGFRSAQARLTDSSGDASDSLVAPAGVSLNNFVGIMAAQDHEFANATQEGSVLTRSIVRAVNEAKSHGEITVESLFQEAEAHVQREMSRLRRANPSLSQQPNLFAHNKGLILTSIPLRGDRSDPRRLRPPEDDALIEEWQGIADRAPQQVEFLVSRHVFPVHPDSGSSNSDSCDPERYGQHLMSIEVVAPADGFLNLIDAPEGASRPIVMYPNEYQQDNRVEKGQVVIVPAPGQGWCLPATLDSGKQSEWNLVVALFSEVELNYFRNGSGGRIGPLRQLPPNARPFLPTGAPLFQAAGSKLLLIEGRKP